MTGDPTMDPEFQALAAEYALGLLTPAEARAFEEAMGADPDLRDSYAAWAADFAAMTDGIAPVVPPADLQGRIENSLFGDTARGGKPGLLARLGLLPAALTGLVAAAIVLLLLQPGAPEFDPELGARIEAADQGLVLLAGFDRDTGLLRIDRQAGSALAGRSQELWIIAPDAAPVSLGLLAEVGVTELAVPPALVAGFDGGTLAVSDEPLGGSPTGAPTGAVLAAGPVTVL